MPDDFSSLADVADCLLAFQERYDQIAASFAWRFTRKDLARGVTRLSEQELLRITA